MYQKSQLKDASDVAATSQLMDASDVTADGCIRRHAKIALEKPNKGSSSGSLVTSETRSGQIGHAIIALEKPESPKSLTPLSESTVLNVLGIQGSQNQEPCLDINHAKRCSLCRLSRAIN